MKWRVLGCPSPVLPRYCVAAVSSVRCLGELVKVLLCVAVQCRPLAALIGVPVTRSGAISAGFGPSYDALRLLGTVWREAFPTRPVSVRLDPYFVRCGSLMLDHSRRSVWPQKAESPRSGGLMLMNNICGRVVNGLGLQIRGMSCLDRVELAKAYLAPIHANRCAPLLSVLQPGNPQDTR